MDPNPATHPPADPNPFITRWQKSGAAERANYQLFLSELCDVLGVPRPDPATPDDAANAYVFERAVTFHHGDGTTSTGRIDLYPAAGQQAFSRLDLIGRGGRVLLSLAGFRGGVLEAECAGGEAVGYLVARAFGERENPDAVRQQEIQDMAITNPVYLHPAGFRVAPMTTRATIRVGAASPWLGGELRFETADGALLETHPARAGAVTREMPASSRVTLTRAGASARTFYLAMENERVQTLLRYLHDGEFLRDWPTLKPGEVPPEAFRLAEMGAALAEVTVAF